MTLLVGLFILPTILFAGHHTHGQLKSALTSTIPQELDNLPYAIYPTNPEYETARFSANKRIDVFPQAIFMPRTEEEASFILKSLNKHHLPFSIRAGGHGYEGNSLSSGYIFDLKNFNAIEPDVNNQTVKIGAARRLGDVINTLGKLDFAIPTGTCAGVGVGGLTLGGGIGMLTRTYGLTSDSVISMTLLSADAEILEVSEHSHPDLFWALRGAGNGSYGIVLAFTFKMHYIPKVTYYQLTWNWDAQKVPRIIHAWQTWIQTLPQTLSSQLTMQYSQNKIEINITGLKVSDEPFNEWEEVFKPLKPTLKLSTGRYVDVSKNWVEKNSNPYFKMKSNIIFQPLSDEVIQKTISFFEGLLKDKSNLFVLFNFDALGGKVREMDSAFYPRQALTWWYQAIYWSNNNQEEEALQRSRQFYTAISSDVSRYCYANTVDYDIGERYLDAYYGDNVNRLIQIKQKYDPQNIFHWKQSIPVRNATVNQ